MRVAHDPIGPRSRALRNVAALRRRARIAGLALASLGVALVAGVGALAGGTAILASLAIVTSEVGYAWGLSQARDVSRTVPMLQLAGARQLVGGCVLLGLSALLEHRGPAHVAAPGVLALLYLVVVASAGAPTVSIWFASVAGATLASSPGRSRSIANALGLMQSARDARS